MNIHIDFSDVVMIKKCYGNLTTLDFFKSFGY